MKLNNPDTFVNWYRIDEPGENPKWQSQCGLIEQIEFGNGLFLGFVGQERTPHGSMTTLLSMKRAIEQEYQTTNTLVFAFND